MSPFPITVFTPTYNRAYCLSRAYESLCHQTDMHFEWLIVDDGSQDDTRELVRSWQHDNLIPIRYIYQENQGMHGAHNTAFRNIESELCICLDSDDMLTEDCIEFVLQFWSEHAEQHEQVAGFMALDAYITGGIIGTPFPEGLEIAHENWLREIAKVRGDKKYIYRTTVAQAAPEYPVFPDEKYGSMGFKHYFIDARYPWLLVNRVIYLVEYLPDGSSLNMYRQYKQNPIGWDRERKVSMVHSLTLRRRFVVCIHYVSNCMFLRKKNFLADSPLKLLTILAIPFGVALHLLIQYKNRKRK